MAKNTLGIERLANWKPNLLGNDKAGVEIDWEERLEGVEDGKYHKYTDEFKDWTKDYFII